MSDVLTHIRNTDGNWGTSRFKTNQLTMPIHNIHFCAHSNEDNQGDGGLPPTNHWSIFLELGPKASARIDVAPGATASVPSMILVETKTYDVTLHSSYLAHSAVPAGTTVETVLKLIIDKKRDYYRASANQEGCRFWVLTFVADLATAGLISSEVAKNVSEALPRYWKSPQGSGSVERPIEKGTFYNA